MLTKRSAATAEKHRVSYIRIGWHNVDYAIH